MLAANFFETKSVNSRRRLKRQTLRAPRYEFVKSNNKGDRFINIFIDY